MRHVPGGSFGAGLTRRRIHREETGEGLECASGRRQGQKPQIARYQPGGGLTQNAAVPDRLANRSIAKRL